MIVLSRLKQQPSTSTNWIRLAMLAALPALLCAGCSSRSPYEGISPGSMTSRSGDKTNRRSQAVQPGDVIEVYVVEDDSLNARYEVREGGNIIIPKIGKIQVAGKTSVEIEAIIKKLLETNQLRTATVMVERPVASGATGVQGKTVFVSGNVGAPGRRVVPYLGDLRPTVYQAILDAGGFSRFADQAHVLVTRRSAEGRPARVKINAEKIRDGSSQDIPVEDGDMIFVPEKAFGW